MKKQCDCRCHLPLKTTHLCPNCFNGQCEKKEKKYTSGNGSGDGGLIYVTPPQEAEEICFTTHHEIQWSGDGYFCSKCNLQFASVPPPQEAEWEKEFDKLFGYEGKDKVYIEGWHIITDKSDNAPAGIEQVKIVIRSLLQEQKEKFKEALGEMEEPLFSERNKVGDWELKKARRIAMNMLRKEVLTKIGI